MGYLAFVALHLRHNWIRTTSTILVMASCIFLFCTLRTVLVAVNQGLQTVSASRLVTRHLVSLMFTIPTSYKERIARVPGVTRVASMDWFFGFRNLDDPTSFFPNFAVDSEDFLAIHPEYILAEDDRQRFLADRRGCIIGPATASRFGWKIGDTFQLVSAIQVYNTGRPYEFVVTGIYQTDPGRYPGTDSTMMFFHSRYFQENTGNRFGTKMYMVEIADPQQAGNIAAAIDELFLNSERATRTETEAALRASFISMGGNLATLLNAIGLAVTFTILLVTANTMSMAARERRSEIAVLKTVGFSSGQVMGLLLAEAVLLAAIGGGLGILMGYAFMRVLPNVPIVGGVLQLPDLRLAPSVGALGLAIALALGLAAGFVPALLAYRSRVSEMLRPV